MTATTNTPAPVAKAADLVTVTIDGFEVSVPKGTLVIRAAEMLGIQIPRFCDHPLLDPIGACRQCLVDVEAGFSRPGLSFSSPSGARRGRSRVRPPARASIRASIRAVPVPR